MEKHIKAISVTATIFLVIVLGYISINFFGEYGLTVFILIPVLIGFLPPFIVGYYQKQSFRQITGLGFITLFASLFALLIFAFEGIICIVMAIPFLSAFVLMGSALCYVFFENFKPNSISVTVLTFLSSFLFLSFDVINNPTQLIPVKTTITVNAPIDTVWKNVVTFSKIDEPEEWLFKTGISYPTDATIEGTGVGAIRYCNFTTGSFVEPITTWNEPNLLQFDVTEHPIPMHEFNPFWDIHPPHLDGYFESQKGQFQLISINENTTQLEGTTWYKLDITPQTYWQLWSDFIVHKIHERVLNHIKKEAEK